MAQNVSEGKIQAVDHGICVPLALELRACLGLDLAQVLHARASCLCRCVDFDVWMWRETGAQ